MRVTRSSTISHYPQIYTEIKDQATMTRVVTEYLSDFNATSKKPMHLVIFQVSAMRVFLCGVL